MGLGPGEIVGAVDDGTERDPDARPVCAAGLGGDAVYALDLALDVRQRFSPEAEDVGLASADLEGGVGLSADRDRDLRAVRREAGTEVVELVVGSTVGERLCLGPRIPQDVDEFVGAGVALLLGEVVTLPGLLGVVAAGDQVDQRATFGQLVEGSQLLRSHRREHGVGAQGDDRFDRVAELAYGRRHHKRVGGVGPVRQQRHVEATVLEGPDVATEERKVDATRRDRVELGGRVQVREADELDLRCGTGRHRQRLLGRIGGHVGGPSLRVCGEQDRKTGPGSEMDARGVQASEPGLRSPIPIRIADRNQLAVLISSVQVRAFADAIR